MIHQNKRKSNIFSERSLLGVPIRTERPQRNRRISADPEFKSALAEIPGLEYFR